MSSDYYPLSDLLHVMQVMRDEEKGCAWTRSQTWYSLTEHTLEEAYELVDAIEHKNAIDVKYELADLLNQVIFYAQIAKEQKLFDFNDIVHVLTDKLIRRHPDVFGDGQIREIELLEKQWQQIKQKERGERQSELDEIALNLPALSMAKKLQMRASAVGFDWDNIEDVFDKLVSEVNELKQVLKVDEKKAQEELGDLMFSCVNLARHLKADPEMLLRGANKKFERRFRGIEIALKEKKRHIRDVSLDELNALWEAQKK
ncbi:nucleoside triphosphate pyrophosphohydrolase [Fastidiosibacter lacustris]|uniref:nucleoside triphosphate pyrophosphohydrolase n=1 Tax=Fastidiosibacter lacustris TaxID=2056695 RepID=UPI000E341BDE|nr:nucleoside triphosphate pyrophosphohydrolase [Fastidiosibacter lacustris]